jgi:fluoroquinolone resistance protein
MPLSEKEFENQTFRSCAWAEHNLKHKVYSHCAFENSDCTKVNWTSSKFLECTMHKCNLSLSIVDGCRLQGLVFRDCKLVGVNFGKCDPLFLSVQFHHCLIDTCNFSDLHLKGTAFVQCMIRETHFSNANLSEANFSGSDLRGSTFHNSNLSKANFIGAINYAINPLTNALKNARFSQPEVLALLQHLGIVIE